MGSITHLDTQRFENRRLRVMCSLLARPCESFSSEFVWGKAVGVPIGCAHRVVSIEFRVLIGTFQATDWVQIPYHAQP